MKILLVERNIQEVIGIRWYIQTYLAGNHQIEYVTNATDAITKLHTFSPEIVLINLDILPDVRVSAIYQPLQRATCHVFAIASDTLYKTAQKAIDIHAKALWTKPLDLEQFLLKITTLPPIIEKQSSDSSFYYKLFQEDDTCNEVFTLVEPENQKDLPAIFNWLHGSIGFQHAMVFPLSRTIICLLPEKEAEKDARMITKHCPFTVNVCIVDEDLTIQQSYQKAKKRLQQCFYEGYGHVLHTSKMVQYIPFDPLLNPATQAAVRASLEEEDLEQFMQYIQPLRTQTFEPEDVRVHLTSILAQLRRFMIHYAVDQQLSFEHQYTQIYRSIIEDPILFNILEELTTFTSDLISAVQKVKHTNKKGYTGVALEYIEKHYAEQDLSLQQVAKKVGVNANYLSTIFRKETGQTFSHTIQHIRISKSKEMLESTSHSIVEIALACGFEDANYFSKTFKKVVGFTPSQYRLHIQS